MTALKCVKFEMFSEIHTFLRYRAKDVDLVSSIQARRPATAQVAALEEVRGSASIPWVLAGDFNTDPIDVRGGDAACGRQGL